MSMTTGLIFGAPLLIHPRRLINIFWVIIMYLKFTVGHGDLLVRRKEILFLACLEESAEH